MDPDHSSVAERLAAECPDGHPAAAHSRGTYVHTVHPEGGGVVCSVRFFGLPCLERTAAQVAADAERLERREGDMARCAGTVEGRAFLEGLERLGYSWSEQADVVSLWLQDR